MLAHDDSVDQFVGGTEHFGLLLDNAEIERLVAGADDPAAYQET